jgi:hypothetical protein
MIRCFISYRHVSPDQELAQAISESLTRSGHKIFVDSKIEVGARWVDTIEREIQSAQFFVVLLSEQSIRSDMVRQEVALAHQLAVDRKLCLLPVRVAYTAALPYDLAAYLNPLQHSMWNQGDPFDRVATEIEAAINHQVGLPFHIAEAEQHKGMSGGPTATVSFDAENLDRLAKALAVYVGPMARVLVSRAAQQAQTWKQLYDTLAEEVPASERKSFLAKRPVS